MTDPADVGCDVIAGFEREGLWAKECGLPLLSKLKRARVRSFLEPLGRRRPALPLD